MNSIYKSISLFTLSLLLNFNSSAQCTYLIPANVDVISTDSSINNSFLPNHQFLICPGRTLTVFGNSTGFNKFYLENNSTVIFSDSIGATPYGSYSFYVKSGATLHYNASSPVAFPFIDTLVWENGATLIDTGGLFHLDSLCSSVVFDYTNLGGAPCGISIVKNISANSSYSISPNPFIDALTIQMNNSFSENEMVIFDLLGKELEHFYLNEATVAELKMKNNWSGIAILEIKNKNGEIHFEKIIRQ